MASPPTRTSIHNLPEELLISIVKLVERDPPSIVHGSEVPSALLWQTVECPDLKNFSLVCQDWRRIAFPILFKYIKIDLNHERGPSDDSFLSNAAWVSKASDFDTALAEVTTSMLLYTSSSLRHGSASLRFMRNLIRRLIRLLVPSRLLLVTQPNLWQQLLSIEVNTKDAWAFEMMYQSVECCQHKPRSRSRFNGKLDAYTARELPPWHLLELQEWNEMRVHGGNCLSNYERRQGIPPEWSAYTITRQ